MKTSNELPPLDKLNSLLSYDPKTGDFLWKVKPSRRIREGSIAGTLDLSGYRRISIDKTSYYAHRLAWFISTGSPPPKDIDHRNGVRSDNRIVNLRDASSPENAWNLKPRKTSPSGYKGVHAHNLCRKFYGKVSKNYRQHHTKLFDTAAEACIAVKSLRQRLHGEFANHGELTP